jgi:hypothetical protein
LEALTTLKQINSTAAEAGQAATLIRSVATDTEVSLDLRAQANQIATELGQQPTAEDQARRDSRMMAAIALAG